MDLLYIRMYDLDRLFIRKNKKKIIQLAWKNITTGKVYYFIKGVNPNKASVKIPA